MNRTPSTIYLDYHDNSSSVLAKSIERGLQKRGGDNSAIPVYFRADDIGVMSESFRELLLVFSHHQIPLNLAVVPTWLNKTRWIAIKGICDVSSPLWCWHQHGWSHKNHQYSGKKCEFGSDRDKSKIENDIITGRERLRSIIGPEFSPFFTPPWNRCSSTTLDVLKAGGFKAVSRDAGVSLKQRQLLPDIPVNVDLHTRKEVDSQNCLEGMALELENAAQSGQIGVMIHHQRMNDNAFHLINELLYSISRNPLLKPVHFGNFF